jgi:hypothetical protein
MDDDLVFKLVMLHGDVTIRDACRIQAVSKDCKELGTDKAAKISAAYLERRNAGTLAPARMLMPVRYASVAQRCEVCGMKTVCRDPFTSRVLCNDPCRKTAAPTISRTDAKKRYRLTDVDLVPCDRYMTSHRLYGNEIVFFQLKDVIETAVLVHGGKLPPPPPPPGTVSAARAKRTAQVDALLKRHCDEDDQEGHGGDRVGVLRSLSVTQSFLKNGGSGIKYLDRCFRAYGEFAKLLEDTNLSGDASYASLLAEYIEDKQGVEQRLRQASELRRLRSLRRDQLTDALAEHSLVLRMDSELCHAYISSGAGDLGDIVLTMREMAFLHEHTDYFSIFQKLKREATMSAKEDVRDEYGYVWDRDEYDRLVEEAMPSRHALSAEARRMAIKRMRRGCVPEWFRRDLVRDAAD